jgi:hypothetical protein
MVAWYPSAKDSGECSTLNSNLPRRSEGSSQGNPFSIVETVGAGIRNG